MYQNIQPAYIQPAQPGGPQPMYSQPIYAQPGTPQPVYAQPSPQPIYAQPGTLQPMYTAQPAYYDPEHLHQLQEEYDDEAPERERRTKPKPKPKPKGKPIEPSGFGRILLYDRNNQPCASTPLYLDRRIAIAAEKSGKRDSDWPSHARPLAKAKPKPKPKREQTRHEDDYDEEYGLTRPAQPQVLQAPQYQVQYQGQPQNVSYQPQTVPVMQTSYQPYQVPMQYQPAAYTPHYT
jgi:hypothetical protein